MTAARTSLTVATTKTAIIIISAHWQTSANNITVVTVRHSSNLCCKQVHDNKSGRSQNSKSKCKQIIFFSNFVVACIVVN